MKKILVLIAFVVLSMVLVNSQAFAITGACSGCHTMHNSQNGAVVNAAAPNGAPQLLSGDCIYCHGIAGKLNPALGTAGYTPKVNDPATPSAAGVFDVGIAMTTRHNVMYVPGEVTDTIQAAADTPPGNGGNALLGPLTCAGSVGCHGQPGIDTTAATDGGMGAMNGYHHNSVPSGSGYRFLRIAAAPLATVVGTGHGTPVNGKGSPTWEITGAVNGNHNVYQGGDGVGGGAGASGNSISLFCARCHGQFHGAFGAAGGPFTRHPIDWSLPAVAATGRDMVANATVDLNNNPFAYGDISTLATNAALTTTGAQVMCLSCHRGHGSAQPDTLRFDYATQVAGAGTSTIGCLGCHYSQR